MKDIAALVDLPWQTYEHIRQDESPPGGYGTNQHDHAQAQGQPEGPRGFETRLWSRCGYCNRSFHLIDKLSIGRGIVAAKIHPLAGLQSARQGHRLEDQENDALALLDSAQPLRFDVSRRE